MLAFIAPLLATAAIASSPAPGSAQAQDQAPVPPPKAPGVVVLFSGKAEDLAANWLKRGTDQPATWKVEDGALISGGGDIVTKQDFGDFQLHLEFRTPNMPNATGQGKGNSGIGLFSRYEVQVLDSYGIETPGKGDCGAVYSLSAPLVNACRPPEVWQTFDIIFRAPRFDANNAMVAKPLVTVIQNGVVIQNNVEVPGMTGIQYQQFKEPGKTGPILLQDHGNRVGYRNIWIVPLPEKGADKY